MQKRNNFIGESQTTVVLAEALGARFAGRGYIARCPAHDDRTPSLSINVGDDGKVLVHCHAGCEQRHVIDALRARGLWKPAGPLQEIAARVAPVGSYSKALRAVGCTERALAIWHSATTAKGTLVEAYLASRGLDLSLSPSLRFHPRLRHPLGGSWPAMVGLVTNGLDGTPMAIHRTFLDPDGGGKAPVQPNKMMLGSCRGGAVRLAPAGDTVMVGEGIETCLSMMQATGHPAWAALSTSGLRALDLPGSIREVIVLADGDDPGEVAAHDCALRLMRQCRRVRIARPPRGLDFNDVLLGLAPGIKGGRNE